MSLRLLVILALVSCDPPEPVISGIPSEPLLVESQQGTPTFVKKKPIYVKPEGVYVDVRNLCGQRLEAVRDQIYDQLGTRQNIRNLGEVLGREIQFTRGTIRVLDGVVYMMSVPLNEPMYRRQALQSIGFPAQTTSVLAYSGEYRINNQWDFRRIRMRRSKRDAETIAEIDVWRWLPRERR